MTPRTKAAALIALAVCLGPAPMAHAGQGSVAPATATLSDGTTSVTSVPASVANGGGFQWIDNTDANALADGEATQVAPTTMECLLIARHLFDATDGAFDVSIGSGLPSLELGAERVGLPLDVPLRLRVGRIGEQVEQLLPVGRMLRREVRGRDRLVGAAEPLVARWEDHVFRQVTAMQITTGITAADAADLVPEGYVALGKAGRYVFVALAVALCAAPAKKKVLFFSKSSGFEHDIIKTLDGPRGISDSRFLPSRTACACIFCGSRMVKPRSPIGPT